MGTIDARLTGAVRWADAWGMLSRGRTVLCAVSGGRDSMVLLHFLWELGRQRGFSVACAHFNHHLRPTASRDEAFVRAWTAERGIPCRIGGGDVAGYCARQGLSTEEGARRLRYAFLEESRRELGADVIATGHHLADQAETVLLNLIRGTGLDGLRGIAPVRGYLIRPLLSTPPETLVAYADAWDIPHVEDESNQDLSYSRNRLRHQVLPVLRGLNSAALENIHRAAVHIAQEQAWLAEEAARRLRELGEPVPYRAFHAQPQVMRREMIRQMLARLDGGQRDITAAHIEAAADIRPGGYVQLPGGLYAAVEDDCLIVSAARKPAAAVPLDPDGETEWDGWRITVGTAEDACLRLPAEDWTGTLTVGPWDSAGRMRTATGWRSMKRIFADYRIPVSRRNSYPVLWAGEEPLAILSLTEGCPPDCREHGAHFTLNWKKEDADGPGRHER